MRLRLKVAENQLEPLEVSFTARGLGSVLICRSNSSATRGQFYLPESHSLLLEAVLLSRVSDVLTKYKYYIICRKRSELHPRVPVSATRGQYYYPQSHSLPLEIITAIQSHYLFHLRSVMLSRFPVSVTRGQ